MPKVTIYTAVWCPWCKRTKEWLKANNIPYDEKDVEADPKNAEEMVQKSGQTGIPVTDVDGQIVVGFDVPALKKVLGVK